MKLVNRTIALLITSTLSFGVFAAQEVSVGHAEPGEKIGVISASGAYTLNELENKLAEKASAKGASTFKITSTSGYNLMHGTAEIYK
ncbi:MULTISPECIES: multiple stress resistance protein BhsA [Tenebrionibacter/Tenebrionicola group]|jgi:multiple stress resistance protein BhsA|uniref:DUF1471 domain-containing protein n=2 Tax=Tenebrionibacter/Tenebrionicola group TaxID=2969848 RepID=A0A8K0XWI3_9ENTR|nr:MULTISPECIES: YdgH/BhsA/McbA-like domain containing protein [Tenebrionibacter/Tenebrionicola group]MBK4714558.1 DUF1471 domain-containing protein [Tenebrionibacter intestinalis]MBV4412282.1 DUF1471 domain-containing protein [Tenebrionicola larvae]MBV5095388.1 DUF1471 domain-containing protein [Tenebrionicola larvae]